MYLPQGMEARLSRSSQNYVETECRVDVEIVGFLTHRIRSITEKPTAEKSETEKPIVHKPEMRPQACAAQPRHGWPEGIFES